MPPYRFTTGDHVRTKTYAVGYVDGWSEHLVRVRITDVPSGYSTDPHPLVAGTVGVFTPDQLRLLCLVCDGSGWMPKNAGFQCLICEGRGIVARPTE